MTKLFNAMLFILVFAIAILMGGALFNLGFSRGAMSSFVGGWDESSNYKQTTNTGALNNLKVKSYQSDIFVGVE